MIPKVQSNLQSFTEIKKFLLVSDSEEIYDYLVELGKLISPIDKKYKIDSNKVDACQSNVWIACENNYIYADSNSIIVKGLLHIILSIVSTLDSCTVNSPEEYIIKEIDSIGLTKHLTTFRKNGLAGSIQKLGKILKD